MSELSVQQTVSTIPPHPGLRRHGRARKTLHRVLRAVEQGVPAPFWARAVRWAFARLFYGHPPQTPGPWHACTWLGVATLKCPLDLWIYQEILWETRPDAIVECGTAYGGSALYLATVCDAMSHGHIFSIDIRPYDARPVHPRITYLSGDTASVETARDVAQCVSAYPRRMVLLDSDHRRDHVLRELELYAPLVTPGQYLIVEDTNVNGHPVLEEFGPGPMEAVKIFLEANPQFMPDLGRERFGLTFNPYGYLRRLS